MHSRSGFSLVELSIVLVILGLLVGGILAGQSLIRASELRAVTTERDAFNTAVHAFRDRYLSLPGDFLRATDVWGTAAACPGLTTEPSTGRETCNGNGDGTLSYSVLLSGIGNERFRMWQHLANAGLIGGTYTGVTGDGHTSNHHVRGVNVPTSRFSTGCWSHLHWNAQLNNSLAFDNPGGSFLFIGLGGTTGSCVQAIFTPEEAWNIDVKSDDGMPATGKTMAYYWDDCTDAATSAGTGARYLLQEKTALCSLHFKGFY